MTKEDKQLLLKDLCARLPYGVYVKFKQHNEPLCLFVKSALAIYNGGEMIDTIQYLYLRPMSSMTEEEKEELKQEHVKDQKLYAECLTKAANGDDSMRGKVIPHFAADWCNKNHFDYRGLIEKGLALEAPEGMYN